MHLSMIRLARLSIGTLVLAAVSACGSGISLDEPIEGPSWLLVQLGDQPVGAGGDPRRDAQIEFDRSSGRVSGSGGCNRFSGGFTRTGSHLKISQLVATKMACLDGARTANEMQFLQVLQTTTSYRLVGPGRMLLIDASGQTLATLAGATAR
ncbi:META domain-containing protein [Variovorax sp. LG9.2]|uniref:META domain-containing protein n=1 Tax=Variovorax sp. LG9.2 TaxID=3048626 RepID=UPI002B225AA1|nr:META domain-containing protein [Variovorax sp. LG9.2]MEB0059780.1 META domain-containing protein [Variovorax sp. LG9.2]